MLNPLLWTGIYILIYAIVNPRRNRAAVALLIAAMMLTVKDWVRMETYTWIMGTTYVIPLFLILIVIWIEKQVLLQGQRFSIVHVIVVAVLNFVIGMTMENIAAGSIVLGVLASLYAWFRRREALKLTLTGLAVSVVAFVLMRLSPGSAYRLMSEHQAWTQLGLFQQIQTNWGNFLTYTFTDNKMMMLFLSGIAALALLHHLLESDHLRGSQIALFVVQETILALAVVACCAQFLQAHTQIAALSLFYDFSRQFLGHDLLFGAVHPVHRQPVFRAVCSVSGSRSDGTVRLSDPGRNLQSGDAAVADFRRPQFAVYDLFHHSAERLDAFTD